MKEKIYSAFLLILTLSIQTISATTVYMSDFSSAQIYAIDSTTNAVFAVVSNTSGFPFVNPFGLAVTQSGNLVYATDRGSNAVYVINPGAMPATSQIVNGAIFATTPMEVEFTPDESKAIVTSLTGPAYVIDVGTHSVIGAISTGVLPPFLSTIGVAITNDSATAYIADNGNHGGFYYVYVVDIATLTATTVVSNASGVPFTGPLDISISSDGLFAYLTDSNKVYKIDTATHSVIGVITNPIPGGFPNFITPTVVAINPSGTTAYVTDTGPLNPTAYVIDTATNTVTGTITPLAPMSRTYGAAVIPDGSVVYISDFEEREIYAINTSGTVVSALVTNGFAGFINPTIVATTPVYTNLSPPENLTGRQNKTDFGLEYALSNLLTWQASPSTSVVGYFVYRNGTKIATLNQSTLQYNDAGVPKGTIQYSVTAFTAAGTESSPISIQVR